MITRFEALKAVDDIFNYCEEIDNNIPENERSGYKMLPDIHKIRKYIIENTRPHGEWVEKTGMRPPEDKGVKFCSNCMSRQPRGYLMHNPIESNFCPICGSDNRPKVHGCSFASEECAKNPCADCGVKEGEAE